MIKTFSDKLLESLKKKNFQKRIDFLAKKYKDKKIIIYGAGTTFNVIHENFDLNKLNIMGLADIKFEDNEEHLGFKTFCGYTFPEQKPNIVLISMYEDDIAEEMFKQDIFPDYGKFKYEPFIKYSLWETITSLFK